MSPKVYTMDAYDRDAKFYNNYLLKQSTARTFKAGLSLRYAREQYLSATQSPTRTPTQSPKGKYYFIENYKLSPDSTTSPRDQNAIFRSAYRRWKSRDRRKKQQHTSIRYKKRKKYHS